MNDHLSLQHLGFLTPDGLELPALLYSPHQPTKKAALFLHGNGSASVFYKPEKMKTFGEELAKIGWSFFAFNNRGAHYIKKFRYEKDGEKHERFLGTALEKIEEAVQDIDGAIAHLQSLGYEEFVLLGESSGANKICVYNHYKPNNPCVGYALIGGGDDTGLWYEALGKEGFNNALTTAKEKIAEGNGEELLSLKISHGIMTHGALLDTIDPDGDYNCFPFAEASGKMKISTKPLFHMFSEIKKPTLVLYGENDIFCSVPPKEAVKILHNHCSQLKIFSWHIETNADHSFSERESEEAASLSTWMKVL